MKKIAFAFLLLLLLIPIGGMWYYYSQYDYDTKKVIEYSPKLTTRIFDRNGEKIANIFDGQHRLYAPVNTIPPRMIEALLAIEDTTFFEHHGVNFDAVFRALMKDVQAVKMVEGASTITQQLVKNTLLTREKKISRKVKEMIYAIKLETELSKEEILERYLNEIYLGHGYYGVRTAAQGYFHKELVDLTLKEIAVLVGLPKAPSFYDPTKNYELSMGRANRVLARMHELGWIGKQTFLGALNEKPVVYDETLTRNKAPYVVDEILRRLTPMFPDIKSGGYTIYTTIDLSLQHEAQEALKKAYGMAVERAQKANDYNETFMGKLNGALVAIDPHQGDVLAMVGGIDYAKSPFDRATQSKRQVGSAFKPFIYQVALDRGYSGATELIDIARTYDYEQDGEEKKWQPKNYEKNYEGFITLREALKHSRNLATINLVNDMGLNTVYNDLQRYGIRDMPYNLSLALGSISLSPFEMAQYYSSFANNGIQVTPFLISEVEKSDAIVYEHTDDKRYITSPEQNFLMTSILMDVVNEGTGKRARVKGVDVAGKTGTTNNAMDAWFIGFTPSIETVVWFGNDDNTPMRKRETGGRVSGPAFAYFVERFYKLYPHMQKHFEEPKDVIKRKIDGHAEYFTDISKPPKKAKSQRSGEEELIF